MKTIRYILFCLFSVLFDETEISNRQGFVGVFALATVLSVFCVSCFLMDKIFLKDRCFVLRVLCGLGVTLLFVGGVFAILFLTEAAIGR